MSPTPTDSKAAFFCPSITWVVSYLWFLLLLELICPLVYQ